MTQHDLDLTQRVARLERQNRRLPLPGEAGYTE